MPVDAAAIMTRAVVTVGPDDTVTRVAEVLTKHGISAVPVCEKDGTVVGMISEGDLMRPFGQENALRRDWWLNLIAEGTELSQEFLDYIRLDRRRARDLMSRTVVSASVSTSLPELADLLSRHRIKRVPILKDGKLVGIVSRADIVRALAHGEAAAADGARALRS
ncbi:MAG: CBS domain-containing protein [Rhodospirillales bacterium]|nr:CBS domain-containing protein [Rhodospirillales bacterium]